MSVTLLALLMLCAAAMSLPQLARAQQRVLITSVSQVEMDRNVRAQREKYEALSAANFVYTSCGKELKVPEADQAYVTEKFTAVTQAYMIAYQDAYVSMTNSAPPQSFVDDVAKTLAQRQQYAVDNVATVLRQKGGCRDGRLRPLIRYMESLQKQDKDLKNAKPVVPAQPYQ